MSERVGSRVSEIRVVRYCPSVAAPCEKRGFFSRVWAAEHAVAVWKATKPCANLAVFGTTFGTALQVGLPRFAGTVREWLQKSHTAILLRAVMKGMQREDTAD